jgi:nicotinamidase-related amidase
VDYFAAFPGLDAGAKFNNTGFWQQPIPVHKSLSVAQDDVVIYDAEGYALLHDFLKQSGVRHVLLMGYNTDMCVCTTTAGYENLRRDFNVFLVGDATIATFPEQPDPSVATSAAVTFASLKVMITQVSWVKPH